MQIWQLRKGKVGYKRWIKVKVQQLSFDLSISWNNIFRGRDSVRNDLKKYLPLFCMHTDKIAAKRVA